MMQESTANRLLKEYEAKQLPWLNFVREGVEQVLVKVEIDLRKVGTMESDANLVSLALKTIGWNKTLDTSTDQAWERPKQEEGEKEE